MYTEEGRDRTSWRGFYGELTCFNINGTTNNAEIYIPYIVKLEIEFSGRRMLRAGITNEGYLMGFDNVGEGPHCRDCIKSGNKNGECNDNHYWVSASSVSE